MSQRVSGFAYGVPATFAVEDDLVAQLRELLPPDWADGRVPDDTACWEITSADHVAVLVNAAELHIAERAPGLVFVHAGAVAFSGRVVLVPGRSFTGKSSLIEALVRAGGTYYSDEFAVLRADGTVVPYPRPIALRDSDGRPSRRIPAAELPAVGTGPGDVRLIAALRYDGAAGWVAARGGPAEGTLALIDNAVAAQSRPAEVLAACGAVAARARFVRGTRADADEAAGRLIKLLDQA